MHKAKCRNCGKKIYKAKGSITWKHHFKGYITCDPNSRDENRPVAGPPLPTIATLQELMKSEPTNPKDDYYVEKMS